jgi:tetratricopeptide (TPR) repeat protein
MLWIQLLPRPTLARQRMLTGIPNHKTRQSEWPIVEDSNSKVARDRMRLDDLDGARRIVEAGLQGCSDQGASPEIWLLRLVRADLLRLRGTTEAAVAYLSAKETNDPPDSGDVPSLIGLKKTRGYCLGQLGKYAQSTALLREGEQMARVTGLLELKCEVHQCQAMLLYLQQDYAGSDRLYRAILDVSEQIGGWYFRANALWGIGKNLMIQKQFQSALSWLEDSLALFESVGARLSIATVWSEMAVCKLGLGDDRKALELLEGALRIDSEADTVQNYQVGLANIGNVYLHRGDHLRAVEYYRRALELAREIEDPVSIQKWSYNIRLAYARLRQSVDQLDSRTA